MSTRRRFTGEFKAKVALEAGAGTRRSRRSLCGTSPSEPGEHVEAAGGGGMREVFSRGWSGSRGDHEGEVRDLHAKISELTVEWDFLAKGLKW